MNYKTTLERRLLRVKDYLDENKCKIPKMRTISKPIDVYDIKSISDKVFTKAKRELEKDIKSGKFNVHDYFPDIKNKGPAADEKKKEILKNLDKTTDVEFLMFHTSKVFAELNREIQFIVYSAMDVDSIDNTKEEWIDFKEDIYTVASKLYENVELIKLNKNTLLNSNVDDIINDFVGVTVINLLDFTKKLPDLSLEQIQGNMSDICTIKATVEEIFLSLLLNKSNIYKILIQGD